MIGDQILKMQRMRLSRSLTKSHLTYLHEKERVNISSQNMQKALR